MAESTKSSVEDGDFVNEEDAPLADEKDGPIEEFKALRAEIVCRITIQQNILTLQLTVSGAVISFALAGAGRTNAFLLILPFTSYMLCGRYARHNQFIANIGSFIREDLAPRIPGGLRWENWTHRQFRKASIANRVDPLHLTFGGPSLLALALSGATIIGDFGRSLPTAIGLSLLWTVALGITVVLVRLTGTFAASNRERRRTDMN